MACKALTLMRKFSECLDFCWPKVCMFRIFVDYGLDFWWSNKIKTEVLIIYHNTFISFPQLGREGDPTILKVTFMPFILWVRMEIEPICDSFDLKCLTKCLHLKPGEVNYPCRHIATPLKVTRLPNDLW